MATSQAPSNNPNPKASSAKPHQTHMQLYLARRVAGCPREEENRPRGSRLSPATLAGTDGAGGGYAAVLPRALSGDFV